MAEWVRAAEAQLETHRWLTTPRGQQWMRTWINAETRNEAGKGDMYRLLGEVEPYKLLTAESIWVSPEMCDVVSAARDGFRPEAMRSEDFIVPTGFVYFAKPLYMLDRNHNTVSVGAMSWCPTRFQRSPDLEPDGSVFAHMRSGDTAIGLSDDQIKDRPDDRWGMSIALYSTMRGDDDSFAHVHREMSRNYGAAELVPLHFTAIEFGDELDEGQLEDEEGRYTGADHWWKTVQTVLRMMQQRVSERSDTALPRPSRRRMERAGSPVREVLVIRLRRPTVKHGEPGETEREWTHRWLVDGHWRNQPYGPKGSPTHHRQIWISPFVKGPEDMPLVIKRRFYKWDR